MAILFGKFVCEDDDKPLVQGTRVVREYAGSVAYNKVTSLIDRRPIDRVEFVHRSGSAHHRWYYGAVLYDTSCAEPVPCIHVFQALLGYDGCAPNFSRSIMRYLGMSDDMFRRMNESVYRLRNANRSYAVLALNMGDEWLYDVYHDAFTNRKRLHNGR